jgi:hypothetical protein
MYYLDEFNQNRVFIRHKQDVSHPSVYLAWELFNVRVAELSICCICSISTVKILCPSLAFPWSALCVLPSFAA